MAGVYPAGPSCEFSLGTWLLRWMGWSGNLGLHNGEGGAGSGGTSFPEDMGVDPKIVGFPPKSSIFYRENSIIFTIHFGGPPLFLETPILLLGELLAFSLCLCLIAMRCVRKIQVFMEQVLFFGVIPICVFAYVDIL